MKKRVLDVAFGLFVVVAILHFAHRGVSGESGLFFRLELGKEARSLTGEKAELVARREELENLNRRLGVGYLDLDLLDERARDVLGYLGPDELVIR
ncbi:MAG: septum formation initiator family protein [Pseudomonadota bacterium]